MAINRHRRMGAWTHEYRRGFKAKHYYEWWDEDKNGNVIDRGCSWADCYCPPAPASPATEKEGA